jgi:hypothetical protein
MVNLQCSIGIAASQTSFAVTLAEYFELLDGKIPNTGVPSSSPLAKIVGLGLPDFFGVVLGPFLATSQNILTLTFVVAAFGSVYALLVFRCPDLPVLGDLFLVFFLILPTCLDSVGQIRSGFFILGVVL